MVVKIQQLLLWGLILIIVLFNYSLAQESTISFEEISTEDGLSQSSVLCIFQDKDGFLWFGTYGGLNRYDGYNFKIYRFEQNKQNSIVDNHIRSIIQDTSGIIMIGTVGGISCLSVNTNQFVNYKHIEKDTNSLSNNSVYKLYIDKAGIIWVCTWGGGLDRIKPAKDYGKGKSNSNYIFSHHRQGQGLNSIASDKIVDIDESSDSILWIATRNGLSRFERKSNKFYNYYNDPGDPSRREQ